MASIGESVLRGALHGRANAEDLRALPILEHLAPGQFASLVVTARWRAYSRGDVIARPGENHAPSTVLIVYDGLTRVSATSGGRHFIFRFLGRGAVIDLAPVPQPLADLTWVLAETDGCTVVSIERVAFESAAYACQRALEEWVRQKSEWNYVLGRLVLLFVFTNVPTRFVRILGQLASETPDGVVRLTHAELGALAGIGEQQATEILHVLRNAGLAAFQDYEHRRVIVTDWRGLMACEISRGARNKLMLKSSQI